MNKVTVKLNNNVRKALAYASTQAETDPSFSHFSYDVDWSNFPNSLLITGHLKNLDLIQSNLSKLVQLSLLKQGIKFRDFRKNFTLAYDS